MKLHLGCGGDYLDGWVNIDEAFGREAQKLKIDLKLNPFELNCREESIEAICLGESFRKLPLWRKATLMAVWNRWLQTGGVLWVEKDESQEALHDLMTHFGFQPEAPIIETQESGSRRVMATGYKVTRLTQPLIAIGQFLKQLAFRAQEPAALILEAELLYVNTLKQPELLTDTPQPGGYASGT